MPLITVQRIINEGSTYIYECMLQDEDGAAILLAQLDALALTLHLPGDSSATGIINSRNAQDVKNLNNVTFVSSSIAVTGATNATPVVVTVTAHGLASGDMVSILGVLGNTGANNRTDEIGRSVPWVIEKVDANSFKLLGSEGNGTYTAATGTMTRNLLQWTMQPLDNVIVGTGTPIGGMQEHVALFEATYATTKKLKHEFRPLILNLGRA